MKTALLTLVVLAGAFWLACIVETPSRPAAESAFRAETIADGWRRTADGWELMSTWASQETPATSAAGTAGALHPLLLGALQGLLSCGALLWFDPPRARPSRDT